MKIFNRLTNLITSHPYHAVFIGGMLTAGAADAIGTAAANWVNRHGNCLKVMSFDPKMQQFDHNKQNIVLTNWTIDEMDPIGMLAREASDGTIENGEKVDILLSVVRSKSPESPDENGQCPLFSGSDPTDSDESE